MKCVVISYEGGVSFLKQEGLGQKKGKNVYSKLSRHRTMSMLGATSDQ